MYISTLRPRLNTIIEVFICLVLQVTAAQSQPACTPPIQRAPLQISMPEIGLVDTLWFGFDSTATYGIDEHLCEFEITIPKQSSSFGYRFINIDSHWGESAPTGLGNGVLCDYRHFNSRAQVDTHLINFGANFPTSWTFRWTPQEIIRICDSARLVDIFGGIIINLNMNTIDSLHISHDYISQLFLFRYGAKETTTRVNTIDNSLPLGFHLEQNYPNPFNPTTLINYQLPMNSYITIKVYDVLGREVATLVNEYKAAGKYEVELNASNLSSGIYFYKLSTKDYTSVKKMVLIR